MPSSNIPSQTGPVADIAKLVEGGYSLVALGRCVSLLELVRDVLECPSEQLKSLPSLLEVILKDLVAARRSDALAAFRQMASLPKEDPAFNAAYVAAFGELMGFESQERDEVVRCRKAERELTATKNVTNLKHRLRLLAGLWLPSRPTSSERSTRRAFTQLEGRTCEELYGSVAVVRALEEYLQENIERYRGELVSLHNPAGNADKAGSDDTRPAPAGYIQRKELEQKFYRLVEDGAKAIALVGFAGMGKTTLAGALAHEPDEATSAVILTVTDGRLNLGELQTYLAGHGVTFEPAGVTHESVSFWLYRLMSCENAPKSVILDNLETTDELVALLPPMPTRSVLLATCRRQGVQALNGCHVVGVDKMAKHEAKELVEKRLPSLSESDVTFVIETLECYPLAIELVCGYVEHSNIHPRGACESIRRETAELKTGGGRQLGLVMHMIVEKLKAEEPETLSCLVLLAFTHILPLSRDFLFDISATLWPQKAQPDITMARALQTLESLFVIRRVSSPEPIYLLNVLLEVNPELDSRVCASLRSSASSYYRMHSLLQGLARQELESERNGMLGLLYRDLEPALSAWDSVRAMVPESGKVSDFDKLLMQIEIRGTIAKVVSDYVLVLDSIKPPAGTLSSQDDFSREMSNESVTSYGSPNSAVCRRVNDFVSSDEPFNAYADSLRFKYGAISGFSKLAGKGMSDPEMVSFIVIILFFASENWYPRGRGSTKPPPPFVPWSA